MDGASLRSRIREIYAIAVLTLLAFWPATFALVDRWVRPEDRTYRHGFLVVAACAWLLYRRREQIALAPSRPLIPGFFLLFGAALVWLVLWRAAIQDPYLLLLPVLMWLAVLATHGYAVARLTAFAFAFLLFAMPAWGSVAGVLQVATAHVVTAMTQMVGVPAQLDGILIRVPAGVFEVELGCSGVHYLTVGLALAALCGELDDASVRRRAWLLALMATLAVLANWVRVFTVVIAGQITDMQHFLVQHDHYWFGWGLFGVSFALFLWIAGVTPQIAPASRDTQPAVATSSGIAAFPYAALLALLVVAPTVPIFVARFSDPASVDRAGALPAARAGWSGPFDVSRSAWQPVFVGADTQRRGVFVGGSGRIVEVSVVTYRQQRQGAELVNYANSLLGSALSATGESIVTADGRRFRETAAVDARGGRSIIWWHYEIGGQPFVRPIFSQLWYGFSALLTAPESRLVAVRVSCEPSCEEARASLSKFVGASVVQPSADPSANLLSATSG